jgi:hypothetical protein
MSPRVDRNSGEKQNLSCAENRTRFVGCMVHSLAAIPTKLSRLYSGKVVMDETERIGFSLVKEE